MSESRHVMIGLETHVQLNTRSKLFCGCANPAALASEPEPNTLTCPACLGLPGSKPRTNEVAIAAAVKVALALGCTVAGTVLFSRKTYFYPDMAKNFQITQYELPVGEGGSVEVAGKRIRIRRVHIEEDPARLVHEGGLGGNVLADYNRSGIPLLEIVTEPDFASPAEARAYLTKLVLTLDYLGVYHPASGAIVKSDANISLSGGARVEVKNITGDKEIERALSYEIVRQGNALRMGKQVARETRMWNPDLGVTQEMRGKEAEEEYGYITEPDLGPVTLRKEVVRQLRSSMPELPDRKQSRLVTQCSLSPKTAESIVSDPDLAALFERLATKADPQLVGSWIAGYLKKTLNYHELSFRESGLQDEWLLYLLSLFSQQKITDKNAELAIRKAVEEKRHPREIVEKYDYLVKRFDLDLVLRDVLEKNPKAVADYRAGGQKALHFLVGISMKETRGGVDAAEIRKRLLGLLGAGA